MGHQKSRGERLDARYTPVLVAALGLGVVGLCLTFTFVLAPLGAAMIYLGAVIGIVASYKRGDFNSREF